MESLSFTIKGNPITKKNSQRLIKVGEHTKVIPSKQFISYQDSAGYYIPYKWKNITTPIEISALFYMESRRKVDLVNLLEALDDILVHYGVIQDDNSQIIVSHDGSRVFYDKDNPRAEVTIRSLEENEIQNCIKPNLKRKARGK